MNSKEEFTVQMKRKVAEIEEILKEYLPKPEGYQKVIMEAMEYRGKKTAANVNERDQQIIWR